jgi:succinoglycan biosynthesis transport protein ExoP
MELRDYLRVLRQSWLIVLLIAIGGAGVGYGYASLQTPMYSSSAKVFVSTSGGDTVQDLAQGNSFSQQRVKTYADLATTPIVLLPVIADLGLNLNADELGSLVTVSAPVTTTIIEIAVLDSDPALAARIATGISVSLSRVVQRVESAAGSVAAVSPVTLTLVKHATVPQKAVSPNVPLDIALGGIAGLIVGIGLAILREILDNRVRNERDVEQITDIAVIGGIVFDPKAHERPLIVHVDPRSPRAESFRSLRTNLQFLDVGRADRSFVVTSSIQSEGKSTTAANLAITLADAGSRVLLVDADLRRPRVDTYMDVEGAVGLTDLLIGRAEPMDVIQTWGQGNLSVLPAGIIPPNPSELLGSMAMVKLLRDFNSRFDVVIFDSPPLLPVTDAAILARIVGGAIVVVAAGQTHKNQLRGALAVLQTINAPISGIVLTMLPTKGPNAQGYGRYGYGYGYGATSRTDTDAAVTGVVAAELSRDDPSALIGSDARRL